MAPEDSMSRNLPGAPAAAGSVTCLIAQARQGTPEKRAEATELLARHFFDELIAVLRRRFPGRSEDVAVDGATSALHRISTLVTSYAWVSCRGELWGLLLTIAGRRALNRLRLESRQTRYVTETDLGGPSREAPCHFDVLLENADVLAFLETARDRQEGPERSALADALHSVLENYAKLDLREIMLAKAQGATNAQVALMVGRSEKTVEYRLRLLRTKLHEQLRQEADA